jgi:transcription elongation factor GreB
MAPFRINQHGELTMSRHRPPEEIRSNYITPEGARCLREELDFLWKVERPKVTQAVSEAAAQGDRSENADYIYGKRRLREIDRRVRHLMLRLDAVKVVMAPPTTADRVFFGAWVRLENEAGDELVYRIVGPDEFDLSRGFISMDSPMGRALMGKREGDEIVVRRPAGMAGFTLLEISYRPFDHP